MARTRKTIETVAEEVPEQAEPKPRRKPSGPLAFQVRRRVGSGWEKCQTLDPSGRLVDLHPPEVLGQNGQGIQARWGAGEYQVVQKQGGKITGRFGVAFAGEPLPAVYKPEPPATRAADASPPDPVIAAYLGGMKAQQGIAQEQFGLVLTMLQEIHRRDRLDSDERRRRDREEEQARAERQERMHQQSLEWITRLARGITSPSDAVERLEERLDEMAERASDADDPGRVVEQVGKVLEGLGGIAAPMVEQWLASRAREPVPALSGAAPGPEPDTGKQGRGVGGARAKSKA